MKKLIFELLPWWAHGLIRLVFGVVIIKIETYDNDTGQYENPRYVIVKVDK